ncbi:MAG: lysophospholipid acyltransferase family protein [Acidobacteria bacterium]|nr:lysophospholipid acyltransferase family protein [Candidatus Sulfomarinibacter sp. MAG AM1]
MTEQSKSRRSNKAVPRRMTWWRRVLFAIAVPVAHNFLRLTWSSFRLEIQGDERMRMLLAAREPVVFAFWHEGLLIITRYVAQLLKEGFNITFLISPSVDGEIGVQLLARYGSKAVRGSARRSGAAALRGLNRAIQRDKASPCVTLDGSKGPRRYCKPGAIMVARISGVPIVPMACAAHRGWRARTWDRHLIPKPASRVVIAVGEPYTVPREMDEEALEAHRGDLEARVNLLVEKAEAVVEAPTDTPVAQQ